MIDYDLTKIKLIAFDVDGVLSSNTITVDDTGMPARTANIKDGYALHLACKLGLPVAIITGGDNEAVRLRYEKLGLQDVHLKCHDKIVVYESVLQKYGIKDENVLYMGDDIPDYRIMKRVGCPCCPSDAAPEIREIALYVSHKAGGQGCGRDVVEQVLKAQGLWMTGEESFVW